MGGEHPSDLVSHVVNRDCGSGRLRVETIGIQMEVAVDGT
ncbi:MAG: hypothetical protein ACI841_000303 [Planctomycetota bacterium]|jgi:hypothetical protein